MSNTTSWAHGVNGNWITSGNWTNGVPNEFSTAVINAKGTYTVTSGSMDQTDVLQMAKSTTLDVVDDTLEILSGTENGALDGTIVVDNAAATLALGTEILGFTFVNNGLIQLIPGSIVLSGTVTLSGTGTVSLGGANSQIISDGSTAQLDNGNMISGFGTIGDSNLSVTNETRGVIDANAGELIIDTVAFTNEGVLKSTNNGLLALAGITIDNSGRGNLAADGGGILLNGTIVNGGSASIASGSTLSAGANTGSEFLSSTGTIRNNGSIIAAAGDFATTAKIDDSKDAVLDVENGNSFFATGAVTSGTAVIGSGLFSFGAAASANVSFEVNSTGTVWIVDPKHFTGTISGMAGNSSAKLLLGNMPFIDNPTVSFAKGVLTVTDPVTKIVDKIKISGSPGAFTTSLGAFNGDTQIVDPAIAAFGKSAQVFAQSIAGFGATSGAASESGHIEDHSSYVIAPATQAPQHG